jgi:hypothetical protein
LLYLNLVHLLIFCIPEPATRGNEPRYCEQADGEQFGECDERIPQALVTARVGMILGDGGEHLADEEEENEKEQDEDAVAIPDTICGGGRGRRACRDVCNGKHDCLDDEGNHDGEEDVEAGLAERATCRGGRGVEGHVAPCYAECDGNGQQQANSAPALKCSRKKPAVHVWAQEELAGGSVRQRRGDEHVSAYRSSTSV